MKVIHHDRDVQCFFRESERGLWFCRHNSSTRVLGFFWGKGGRGGAANSTQSPESIQPSFPHFYDMRRVSNQWSQVGSMLVRSQIIYIESDRVALAAQSHLRDSELYARKVSLLIGVLCRAESVPLCRFDIQPFRFLTLTIRTVRSAVSRLCQRQQLAARETTERNTVRSHFCGKSKFSSVTICVLERKLTK